MTSMGAPVWSQHFVDSNVLIELPLFTHPCLADGSATSWALLNWSSNRSKIYGLSKSYRTASNSAYIHFSSSGSTAIAFQLQAGSEQTLLRSWKPNIFPCILCQEDNDVKAVLHHLIRAASAGWQSQFSPRGTFTSMMFSDLACTGAFLHRGHWSHQEEATPDR